MTDDLITTEAVAALLRVSPRRVQQLVKAGRMTPALTVRGAYLFTRESVLVFQRKARLPGRPRRAGSALDSGEHAPK